MAKKILVINAHPDAESLNAGLARTYATEAAAAGADVKTLVLRELRFNPNLAFGYRQRSEWEPDLHAAWDLILWADHLVWVHPVWWGGLPALFKGFLDRVFLPGKAFKYRENSVWWDKLLTGKTARIICTLDQPYLYYRFINRRPGIWQLKKMTLEFCGISPVRVTAFGPIRNSAAGARQKMFARTARDARRDAR